MAYAQMRTPFCDLESHKWRFKSSRTSAKEIKKTTELFGLGCPYIWRRKRDSNPRGFGPNGFQDRLVVTASIFLHITATHRAAVICREYLHGSEKFIFQNPLRIPHDVIWELAHQWRSEKSSSETNTPLPSLSTNWNLTICDYIIAFTIKTIINSHTKIIGNA